MEICITAAIMNMFPTKKILGYSYIEQALDLVRYMVIAFLSYLLASFFSVFSNLFLCIITKFFIGTAFYMGMLYIIKDSIFIYTLKNIIKNINNRIKK